MAVAAASLTICLEPVVAAGAGSLGPWGVAPAANGSSQNARPFFDYSQPAGGTIHDAIAIFNLGDYPLTYDLYSADGYNLSSGAFALRGKSEPRSDVGAWVQLSTSMVSVPPHEKAIVPFAIAVPLETVPGDHAGGIVALMRPATAPEPRGNQVETRQGVGARIYLRVPGALHPSVAVTGLDANSRSAPFGGGRARLNIHIVNTGNTRLDGQVRIQASGIFGTKTLPPIHVDSLLPGSRLDISRSWHGLPFAGPYRLSISITSSSVRATGAATVWVVPWALLIIVALLVIALVVLLFLRRRSRQASQPAMPDQKLPPQDREQATATVR